ncbi:Uncharacterised protein [Achromobacter denitrificans]|uniref:hypothetical protein n=1 Tax=Achromobacter denitrificans TaxID=32002 RepID=UPI0009685D69|nr:hypothetical protein [Achromobacter denitrificans]ASC66543.1 hypothetical protein B9P52_20695 [Achromobacter denitrificans]OLU07838.1 hypothetical protein BVK87_13190 [Achromobacter denitrificans]QKH42385.1 hypothetical protein FOC82_13215 [Achromobacter denitrificans]QKH50473.1 hypothetical protein FOC80_13935 [Achromobacter denitrificans]CAB3664481.1 hypothetical protein LMG1231_00726 [Achromobacter denitrificans]
MKTHEVFGIQAEVREYSYIDRGDLDLEFLKLIERQHTHIAIRGASKAGKSWLRQRVLHDPIIVQCRLQYTTLDIYRDALAKLDISIEGERTRTLGVNGRLSASGEAGFKLLAKVTGEIETEGGYEAGKTTKVVGKDLHDLDFIAEIIRSSGRILVIEDFHYLTTEEQKKFAFDLKTLWDYKTYVVVVGVWISENMLITLNPDLSDRIEEISVTWQEHELKAVLSKGAKNLGLELSEPMTSELARISYGSVGLVQKLALRTIADELDIPDGSKRSDPLRLDFPNAVKDAAMHVSEQLNQLYQAFAKRVCEGIRNRPNSTGIYAHAMAAIMSATDEQLSQGLSARVIYAAAHARQPRIQMGNLKAVLSRFPELQVDSDGRGLVLAYDPQDEKITVVDRQLLLYRQFATVRWPWEDLIDEVSQHQHAFDM